MAYKQKARSTMPESIRYNIKQAKREIDYTVMDQEVVPLCKAINSLPGVITTKSCFGHGKTPIHIWIKVDATPLSRFNENSCMQGLFFLTRCTDNRYWKHGHEWEISLSVGDTYDVRGLYPTMFLLSSKAVGEEALVQATDLVANMVHHLNQNNFKSLFAIDTDDFSITKNDDGSLSFKG